jgi:hypothetical protein
MVGAVTHADTEQLVDQRPAAGLTARVDGQPPVDGRGVGLGRVDLGQTGEDQQPGGGRQRYGVQPVPGGSRGQRVRRLGQPVMEQHRVDALLPLHPLIAEGLA